VSVCLCVCVCNVCERESAFFTQTMMFLFI
jgi:hypothetical protein